MSATATKTPTPTGLPAATFNRILDEGYGPGAWYGSDLRAAVGEVSAATAFTRPAKGRHNIAEVALHARVLGERGRQPADRRAARGVSARGRGLVRACR